MKIAVISDLHLGFRQYGSFDREKDFYNQFNKVCLEINKQSPDIVIIAGDLFDKPNPSPSAINAYKEGIMFLDAIVCTIKGNHTMILRDNHYSIDEFFGKNGFEHSFYEYLNDESFECPSHVRIDGITYRNNSEIDEFLEVQKKMAQKISKNEYKILVVHQSFKEFCGFFGEELSIEDIDYNPYDAIICGHIHSRVHTKLQNGTWFIQPGSIERMNTLEALDEEKNGKGFYLIDTNENSVEFYRVECDRKFLLGDINIDNEKDLEEHLESLNNDLEKMKVPPIISYTYYNNIENIDGVRDKIGLMNKSVLLNKSNIHNKVEKDIVLEITDNEMPTVLEAINMYGGEAGLDEKEIGLAIDLYDNLNNNISNVETLLENYFEKNKKEYVEEEIIDEELDEVLRYFEE